MDVQLPAQLAVYCALATVVLKYGWDCLEASSKVVEAWDPRQKKFGVLVFGGALAGIACALTHTGDAILIVGAIGVVTGCGVGLHSLMRIQAKDVPGELAAQVRDEVAKWLTELIQQPTKPAAMTGGTP